MIGISRLYLGHAEASEALRYGRPPDRPGVAPRPVVVWNLTPACNLRCVHCYAGASDAAGLPPAPLAPAEELALLDDLAGFGCPAVLFSGGEPLLHPRWDSLAAHAVARGLRVTFSSNGTLIDAAAARTLARLRVSYVGISLDGLAPTHDRFRGAAGAFDRALAGMRACREAGVKVGLRYTLTRHNAAEVPAIFELLRAERIPRACFYHLVYSGRGRDVAADDLDAAATRRALDGIIDDTVRLHREGWPAEILTVDNHADGPYLYLRMLREGHPEAARVRELLGRTGGNSSGARFGCVGWDGTVYPDQFWRNHSLGNVRERPFSAIWSDPSSAFLGALRQKAAHVQGRCRTCRFLDACGGNFRARGEAVSGDPWAPDPACFLTDAEIRAP